MLVGGRPLSGGAGAASVPSSGAPSPGCQAVCNAAAAQCGIDCNMNDVCLQRCSNDFKHCMAQCGTEETRSIEAPVPLAAAAEAERDESFGVNLSCLFECEDAAHACQRRCADNTVKQACDDTCFHARGACEHKCASSAAGAAPAGALVDASNIAEVFAAWEKEVSSGNSHLKQSAHVPYALGSRPHFEHFKRQHRRSYATPELEAHRFGIFQSNVRRAAELQRLNPSASFGANRFADLHPTEFKQRYLKFQPAVGDAALLRKHAKLAPTLNATDLPASFDWRKPTDGRPVAVTSVKDQGQCGSCWAFSAIETVESAVILSGQPKVDLSVQQLVDCDTVDEGCSGGDTVTAYKYLSGAGIQSAETYPYTSGDSGLTGTCLYDRSKVAARISGFKYATPACFDTCIKQDEEKLKHALHESGPVSICVNAAVWQFYMGGILTSLSGCSNTYSSLDHCVQLVGYGVDDKDGTPFWSVRNTWAESWGEQGYIRLKFGENTCGVADEATLVTLG